MPNLGLLIDLRNFYTIRQQTAFNLVLTKHTALLLQDCFLWCHFLIKQCLDPLEGSRVLQDLS